MIRVTEFDRKASVGGVHARTAEADVAVKGRRVTGWASVFDYEYRVAGYENGGRPFTEVVRKGAFRASLQRFRPVCMWAHGMDSAVGSAPIMAFEDVREDGKGLYFAGDLFDVPQLEHVRAAIAAGVVGASFRFRPATNGERWKNGNTYRELTAVEVSELGPVAIGASPAASVSLRNNRLRAEIAAKPAAQRSEHERTRLKALAMLEREAQQGRDRRYQQLVELAGPQRAAEIVGRPTTRR